MKNKNKIILSLLVLAIVVTGSLSHYGYSISSFFGGDDKSNKVIVKAQTSGTPFVTVSVERLTQNHLPNITGTCSVGDNMVFTIKKGNTGVVSETINKACTVSPYSLNPTITLPDGKYRVDVSIAAIVDPCAVFSANGTILSGTTGNNTLRGTVGNDIISGNGGNDRIFGLAGNDTLYARSSTSLNTTGNVSITGDGGCDTIYGGAGNNAIDGTNQYLRGVGKIDTIIIGLGPTSIQLSDISICVSYYLGNGENDYANIYNFGIGDFL
jgi:Ca2+-binding RTX toxin-like protein